MGKKGSKTDAQELRQDEKKMLSNLVGFFVILIFTVFPLIYHDYYFDILETKYYTYVAIMLTMIGLSAILMGIFWVINKDNGSGKKNKNEMEKRKLWKRLQLPDIAMLCFVAAAVVSTLQSEYLYESFWGNEGRYSGLFLILIYGAGYFIITRFLDAKQWYLDAFLVAGMLACLFGITDYFQMDLLGFKEHIAMDSYNIFTSTFGNINTYTSFVALVMGTAATLFVAEKNQKRMIWYYICVVIAFFAIIMGNSDNAYLSLAALFGLLPFYAFIDRKGVARYGIMLATFFTVIWCISGINAYYDDAVAGVDSLFQIIANFKLLLPAVLLLWAAVAGIWWYLCKKGDGNAKASKYFRIGWLVLILICTAVIIFLLIEVNVRGNAEKYAALSNYLLFNDLWGTHRGHVWRISMETFRDFPFMHQLFGFGPETFGIATWKYRQELIDAYNEIFDSAHNEYIQYLITIGIAGVTSYVFLIVSVIREVLKKGENASYIMAALFACLCYWVQASVNVTPPIVTPLMWTMVMFAVAACKNRKTR